MHFHQLGSTRFSWNKTILGVVDQDYQVISDVAKNTALKNIQNYIEERNRAVVFLVARNSLNLVFKETVGDV